MLKAEVVLTCIFGVFTW